MTPVEDTFQEQDLQRRVSNGNIQSKIENKSTETSRSPKKFQLNRQLPKLSDVAPRIDMLGPDLPYTPKKIKINNPLPNLDSVTPRIDTQGLQIVHLPKEVKINKGTPKFDNVQIKIDNKGIDIIHGYTPIEVNKNLPDLSHVLPKEAPLGRIEVTKVEPKERSEYDTAVERGITPTPPDSPTEMEESSDDEGFGQSVVHRSPVVSPIQSKSELQSERDSSPEQSQSEIENVRNHTEETSSVITTSSATSPSPSPATSPPPKPTPRPRLPTPPLKERTPTPSSPIERVLTPPSTKSRCPTPPKSPDLLLKIDQQQTQKGPPSPSHTVIIPNVPISKSNTPTPPPRIIQVTPPPSKPSLYPQKSSGSSLASNKSKAEKLKGTKNDFYGQTDSVHKLDFFNQTDFEYEIPEKTTKKWWPWLLLVLILLLMFIGMGIGIGYAIGLIGGEESETVCEAGFEKVGALCQLISTSSTSIPLSTTTEEPCDGCNCPLDILLDPDNSTNNQVVVTSPRYPKKYKHNSDCTWNILATRGQIRLTFTKFNLEWAQNCRTNDYIFLDQVTI